MRTRSGAAVVAGLSLTARSGTVEVLRVGGTSGAHHHNA